MTDSLRDRNPEEGLNFCRELPRTHPSVPVVLRSLSVHHRREEINSNLPNIIAQTGVIQEVIRVIFQRLFPAQPASIALPATTTPPANTLGTNF